MKRKWWLALVLFLATMTCALANTNNRPYKIEKVNDMFHVMVMLEGDTEYTSIISFTRMIGAVKYIEKKFNVKYPIRYKRV